MNTDLIQRLRIASAGRIEWRIMSPARDSMVMWFSREGPDAVLDPEREARAWLEQHQRDYPGRFAGHVVESAIALSQRDRLMQEAADELEKSDAQVLCLIAAACPPEPRPLEEWEEDMGGVLWWRFPVDEEPYCGHPNCDTWPGYHTHWTPLMIPGEPTP